MKIGVNLWIWESPFRTDQHLHLLAKAKSMGAETVEFAVEDDVVVDATALRASLLDLGLECSLIGLFGPHRDLSSEDASVRKSGLEYGKRCLDTAAEVGAKLYSGAAVGVGGNTVLSKQDKRARLQYAADCLHELGDYAAQAGTLLCVEILNRYECNLVNTAEQACGLIELANHPAVGIHLDTFHMSMEERNLGEAIRTAGQKLYHLHGSESHRGTPGNGLVHWHDVATALKDVHYQRSVVIESFNPQRRLAVHARFWRPFAASPDALAQQGLDFLRRALRGEEVFTAAN